EPFGPYVTAGLAMNQLGRDSHLVPGLADAALKDVGDAKFSRDLADIHRLPLECESRVAGNHFQGRDFRQVGRDIFADAIAEVTLLGVAAHVLEWKHAHGNRTRAAAL